MVGRLIEELLPTVREFSGEGEREAACKDEVSDKEVVI